MVLISNTLPQVLKRLPRAAHTNNPVHRNRVIPLRGYRIISPAGTCTSQKLDSNRLAQRLSITDNY